jgi:hypothetical protein
MLALGLANTVGVVLFATLYAVAGAKVLSQAAFLGCLAVLFPLVTFLWAWTERRHRGLEMLARLGRAAAGLVIPGLAIPALVLMPLFWLDTQLPPEAGVHRLLAPVMALLLISLVLVALTNVIGAVAIGARAVIGRGRRPRI